MPGPSRRIGICGSIPFESIQEGRWEAVMQLTIVQQISHHGLLRFGPVETHCHRATSKSL